MQGYIGAGGNPMGFGDGVYRYETTTTTTTTTTFTCGQGTYKFNDTTVNPPYEYCASNQCTCTSGGTGATGTDCANNGDALCTECPWNKLLETGTDPGGVYADGTKEA